MTPAKRPVSSVISYRCAAAFQPTLPVCSPAGHISRSRGLKDTLTVNGSVDSISSSITSAGSSTGANVICRTVKTECAYVKVVCSGRRADPREHVTPRDLERIPLDGEREPQVIEQLHRIDPGFEATMLVADERRSAPDDVHERALAGGPLEPEATEGSVEGGDAAGGR